MEQEQQVVWYILHPFTPLGTGKWCLGKKSSSRIINVPSLLRCVAEVLTSYIRAPKRMECLVLTLGPQESHTNHQINDQELSSKSKSKRVFLLQHLVPSPFPLWATMFFLVSSSHLTCRKMNPWFVFFSHFPTGNGWQHYGSPWGTGEGEIARKIDAIFSLPPICRKTSNQFVFFTRLLGVFRVFPCRVCRPCRLSIVFGGVERWDVFQREI